MLANVKVHVKRDDPFFPLRDVRLGLDLVIFSEDSDTFLRKDSCHENIVLLCSRACIVKRAIYHINFHSCYIMNVFFIL